MTARSKQGHRKKTQASQPSAPQTAKTRERAQTPAALEREATPPQKTAPAHSRQTATKRQNGKAPTSTLYLTAVLCLLLGIYLGTLLPTLRGVQDAASHAHQQSPQQQKFSPSGQETDHAARHRDLEEAVRKNPQDLHAWIQLGNHLFDDHKPREAIRAYEQALSIKGDNPDVLTDMGIMHRQLGEFERAAERFTQAGAINPLHEQSRFNLGVVLFFDLNRKDEARKVWRELLGINPEARTPDGALLRTMLDEWK